MKTSDSNLRVMAWWGARVLPVVQRNQVLVPRNGNTCLGMQVNTEVSDQLLQLVTANICVTP